MPARMNRRLPLAGRILMTLTASAALVACTGAQGAAAPSHAASTQAGSTDAPSSTPAAVAQPAATAAPDVGPADYATWVEIQGFGGSSGLRQVLKGAKWIQDHPAEGSAFDIDQDMRQVDRLAAWLDAHPATPCWADYHSKIRSSLDRIHDAFSAAHDARAAGRTVPLEVAAQLVAESQAAFDLAAPTSC